MLQKNIICEEELWSNSTHTMVDWCNFLREVCEENPINNANEVDVLDDDGLSKIVKIDESLFFYREYHRELWHPGH